MDDNLAVEAQVQRLEDIESIKGLLHELTLAVDDDAADDWLECFTVTGRFSWAPSADADPLLDVNGRDDLREWFEGHRVANPVGSQTHLMLHPVIEVTGDTATVRSSYVTLKFFDGEIVVATSGRYRDRLDRQPDRRWLLSWRHCTSRMMRGAAASKGTHDDD